MIVVFCDSPVKHLTHVFTVHHQQGYWFEVDITYGRLRIDIVGEPTVERYERLGCPAFEVEASHSRIWCPVMPISCVAFTKRLLGINKPFILTAKQLYNHLRGR